MERKQPWALTAPQVRPVRASGIPLPTLALHGLHLYSKPQFFLFFHELAGIAFSFLQLIEPYNTLFSYSVPKEDGQQLLAIFSNNLSHI